MSSTETGPFATLVQDALNNAVTPDKIAAKVAQHVDKAVDEAIRDAMHTWSGTGKAVKAAIEDSLRVNSLDLPAYGNVVADILRRQIEARVAEVVSAKLTKDMEGLLTLAPKRAKLSDLVAELLGPVDEDPCSCGGRQSVYCRVEWSDYGSVTVYLAEERPRSNYEADIQFTVSLPKSPDKYARGEVPEGAMSHGRVKGMDLKRDVAFGYGESRSQTMRFGRWFGFEQKILAMYACGTVIEIDEDSVVTERDY